jgi:carbonic anhydrase
MKSSYQSPIALDHENQIKIHKKIHIMGVNRGAEFNNVTKNFEVKDDVYIIVANRHYRLEEYHFHVTSEHKVNGNFYPAEIHYVFIQIDDNGQQKRPRTSCHNLCCLSMSENTSTNNIQEDIVVISRVILDVQEYKNLDILQVKVPHFYYEYDGTLTTGNYAPVRWIVGETPIHFDIRQLERVAKPAKPLQDLDGRIVIYSYPKSR